MFYAGKTGHTEGAPTSVVISGLALAEERTIGPSRAGCAWLTNVLDLRKVKLGDCWRMRGDERLVPFSTDPSDFCPGRTAFELWGVTFRRQVEFCVWNNIIGLC
jgi:hypothetical protein